MKSKVILAVAFFSLSVLLFSCSSSRDLTETVRNQVRPELMHQRMASSSFKFNQMSAKLSVKYEYEGDSKALKAVMKVQKDSIIWISVKIGMIEVARVVALKDTIKLLNRAESTYFIGSYDYFKKNYNFDLSFEFIQSLVSGNAYYFDEKKKYKSAVDEGCYYLSNLNKKKIVKLKEKELLANLLVQSFWTNADYKLVKHGLKLKGNDIFSTVSYSEFEEVEGQQFAKDGELLMDSDKPVNVKWHFTKVTLNKPLTFSFTIPEKYEQVN